MTVGFERLPRVESPTLRALAREKCRWQPVAPDSIFGLGRQAMLAWLKKRGLTYSSRLAVPALMCCTIRMVLQKHVKLVVYPLRRDLTPDLTTLTQLHQFKRVQGILITEFFGSPVLEEAQLRYLAQMSPILLDRAHGLPLRNRLNLPRVSMFLSLRKLLPEGFGGNSAWYFDQDGPDVASRSSQISIGLYERLRWQFYAATRWLPRRLEFLDQDPIEEQGINHLSLGWADRIDWSWVESRIDDFRSRLLNSARQYGAMPVSVGLGMPTLAQPFWVTDATRALKMLHKAGVHAYPWPGAPDDSVSEIGFVNEWLNHTVCIPLLHSCRLSLDMAQVITRILATHAKLP